MNESDGEDSIVFNQDKIPQIITIKKDRETKDQKPENILTVSKGKSKIQLSLISKQLKINKEDIFSSLKKLKKTERDEKENKNNFISKINISFPSNRTMQNTHINYNLRKIEQEEEKYMHNKINQIIFDSKFKHIKMKNLKNRILNKNSQNKLDSTDLLDKNQYAKGNNNQQSDRIYLKTKDQYNYKIENDSFIIKNNPNLSEVNNTTNQNFEKKMNMKINYNLKEFTRNNSLNIDRRNSTNLITSIINLVHSSKSHLSDKTQNSFSCDRCFICERNFSVVNLCCSECNIHFFCRKCIKTYCQDLIERGIKRMKCPVTKCNFDIYEEFLKSILTEDYFKLLGKQNKDINNGNRTSIDEVSLSKYNFFNAKIKQNSKNKNKNIRLYNNKNVIDINSNIMFYNVRKYKDDFCPKCHEPSVFTKTHTLFNKCLNCGYKMCKYCNKEYITTHLVINYPDHCKVYFRKGYANYMQNNFCYKYLIQLIYIVAMFYITFAFCFLLVFKSLKNIINIRKNEVNKLLCFINGIKYFVCYSLSIIVFLIIFPFLFVWTPFFPSIIALTDGCQ